MTAQRKASGSVVKISTASHAKLQEMARSEQRPMGEIVNDLIERYEREQFWARARASIERLRDDPVAWKDYLDEVALWDQTSGDGLENEESYYTPEQEAQIEAQAGHAEDR